MAARGRDEDGYAPDFSNRSGGQWETGETAGVSEAPDVLPAILPGMVTAADVGDARPVSLLGLRMPDREGDHNATVSRRPGRPRVGTGRVDGPGPQPPMPRLPAPAHPAGGDARSRSRMSGPQQGPGGYEPDPPATAAEPHHLASAGPAVATAPAAPGWTPDVGAFLPGAGPVSHGSVPAGSPETLSPDLTWPDVAWPGSGSEPGSGSGSEWELEPVVTAPMSTYPDVGAGRAIRADEPGASGTDCRLVHVIGFDDGCGRTTVAAGLEMAFAASRRDRGIAVEVHPDQRAALAGTDTLVVATGAGGVELAAAHDVLVALAGTERGDLAASMVIAVVEDVGVRWSGRARRRLARLAEHARAVVVVPFDPVLAGGPPFAWSALRRRTRAAFGELALAVEAASD